MSTAAWVLGVHLLTQHAPGCPPGLKAVNPGLYLRAESGLTVGGLRNSYGRSMVYAGWTGGAYGLDVTLGVARYEKRHSVRIAPLLVPSVELGRGFRLSFLPALGSSPAAAHLSWETTL